MKFLLNLPEEELTEQRLTVHFEYCYFYYLDQDQSQSLSISKEREKKYHFFNLLLKAVPILLKLNFSAEEIVQSICKNYEKVPVHGVIILNLSGKKILLVESRQS